MRKILLIIFLLVSLVSMPYVAFAGSQQTSSTTADTIIDNARSYLNQDDVSGVTPFCSDAQMLVWLNDGMVDLTTLGLSGQSTEAITLVADTIEYCRRSSRKILKNQWP